jgi:hypothetical protein
MSHDPHPIPASTSFGVALQLMGLAVAAGIALAGGWDRPHRSDAVAFAAGVCLVAVGGAWIAARRPGGTPAARTAAALGVVCLRIFPALAALGWLQTPAGSRLREAGAGGMLVAFYLTVLAADVILNIIGTRGNEPAAGSTRAN